MALELDTRQRAMLQEMGVHVWLPECAVAIAEPVQAAAPRRPEPASTHAQAPDAPTPHVALGQAPVPAQTVAAASPDWAALVDTVGNCQACGLCAGRSRTTLLAPAAQAACDWMVLGDPPDEDEDRAGAPFAGADGLLLANMLRALGLHRANPLPSDPAAAGMPAGIGHAPAQRAYVSNVLKCRPAHGAIPQAAELAQCTAHLQQEIALVQPKMILAMGRFANQVLLSESPALASLPLGKLRGTVHRYQGILVVVTYPPKLLMRNSADKAKAWADLCLAATQLEP
jgi:DNA polymerase